MPPDTGGAREMIPLSAINQFLFCPRRAALIHVEGIFKDNEHTLRGDIVHEHADLRGYEVVQGVKLLRALPVFSDRLGLSGKCDIVEQRPDQSLFPVEFKVGKRRQWENDDAQLCAQALCLEEMFHVTIPRGAIFHADSKRRREIEFSPELRALTEKTIAELHALLDSTAIPRAEFREACEECSLYEICLPRVTSQPESLHRAAERLFET
jgi:CRISPR-associated exonuclease Cas4